jgi:HAD superfamily phosphoserine phosphatase-like hydrolase
MAAFYLCDFDGTVAREDVGNRFFSAFTRDRAAWDAIIDEWLAGTLGGRKVLARECRLMDVDEERAAAFVAGRAIDPSFPDFVAAARAAGGDVAIASDGLLFYVRRILDAHGLDHVPARANGARFVDGGLVPEFGSPDGTGCGRCGTCKGAVLAELARGHARTVFVGDGLSDRCGARAAGTVYAKHALLDYCRREGIAATPFETFADVARAEGLAPAPAGPGGRTT